jgi:hypothetical protein
MLKFILFLLIWQNTDSNEINKDFQTLSVIKPKTRKHGGKKKMNYFHSDESIKYGVELPAFSFDYTEFFSAAVIERSPYNSQLHLTMFLLGQNENINVFDAISTDEETLYSWNQHIKAKQLLHANISNSALFCLIDNNEIVQAHHVKYPPYQVPAQWVVKKNEKIGHFDKRNTSLNSQLAILRCNIKNGDKINLKTLKSKQRLHVDIIRKQQFTHKQQQQEQHSKNVHQFHANKTTSTNSSNSYKNITNNYPQNLAISLKNENSLNTNNNNNVIISFSVEWRTRQTGYAFDTHRTKSSVFDPWMNRVDEHNFVDTNTNKFENKKNNIGLENKLEIKIENNTNKNITLGFFFILKIYCLFCS